MITLYIILITWFTLGIITAWILFGITSSISEIYYKIIERFGKIWGSVFTIWFFGLGFMTSILCLEALDGESYQVLGFLAGAGLAFVGAAPLFKLDSQKYVHFSGAIVSALSIISILIIKDYVGLLFWTAIIGSFIQFTTKLKDATYWYEMVAFVSGFIWLGIIYL